ncbi:MAG: carboxymuconolactone decarboxylase family protein [Thermoplasmata archaeon]
MNPAAKTPRMNNPVLVIPDALTAPQSLGKAVLRNGAPREAIALTQLRASQINGCSVCVDMHTRMMRTAGEPEARLYAVSAWQDSPLFNDAERAALALAEAVTRIGDRSDPVPDAVWEQAARHYTESELAALIIGLAMINAFNRINVATRQVPADWKGSDDPEVAKSWGDFSASDGSSGAKAPP